MSVVLRRYKVLGLILFNTFVLLVALEVAASVVLWLLPSPDPSEGALASYYKTQEWGAAYVHESFTAMDDVGYEPYVMWKTKPHVDSYVRVDRDGNRVTPGAACTPDAYKVFMFGGSTMWGFGVPDWGTVPAYVQTAFAERRDRPVCVTNFGQPAWVSGQGVIELLRRLQAGEVPDLVIFYDGYNDVAVLWTDGVVGGHFRMGSTKDRLERHGMRRTFRELVVWTHIFRLLERVNPRMGGIRNWPVQYEAPADPMAATPAIVHAYLNTYAAVGALAASYGFQYAMFWQPELLDTRRPLSAEEQEIVGMERQESHGKAELMRVVNESIKVESRTRNHLFVITDLFETVPAPVYLDAVHLTHVGNQLIAKRMVDALATSVLSRQK